MLREATQSVPTSTIAARLMAQLGMDQDNRRVRDITERVSMTLRHQGQRSVVWLQAGLERVLLWELVPLPALCVPFI